MHQISIQYMGQLATAAESARQDIALPSPETSLLELLRLQAEQFGEPFRGLVFNADGVPHPTLLAAIDGKQVRDWSRPLEEAKQITILTPMAGG